jgi:4-hydroxy-tetrahydrodipicolinate reductase
MTIRVAISGSGRMGREVLAALQSAKNLEPVGVVDALATADSMPFPDGSGSVPLRTDPAALFAEANPDVIVDFTNAEWTPRLAPAALEAGVRLVIGTSGLTEDFVDSLRDQCAQRKLGAVIGSNFALGAVMMQQMARIAAGFYDHVEIIELHHDQKVDAPSGTALATANLMDEVRSQRFTRGETQQENLPGTRGGEMAGITIHSVRLPGFVAHQEVIFGGPGETLTIRHDSTSRESFMPGVLLAVRAVMKQDGLVVGLERILGLA